MKFNVNAFGLTLGIVWGAASLILGLLAMSGYGADMVAGLGKVYIGYEATVVGALIGGVWGFIDAYIGGIVIAWLYNKLS